jgi:antitoxin (DNA-binding transcriptional repressor) of toxin-antitoxin stability system
MSEIVLSVTEASRNFADCVNRAHYQNQTFLLMKNGAPFAKLVPAGKRVCRGRDLAKALMGVNLSDAEARIWQRDLKTARKKLKPPPDRWK